MFCEFKIIEIRLLFLLVREVRWEALRIPFKRAIEESSFLQEGWTSYTIAGYSSSRGERKTKHPPYSHRI